MKKNNVNTAPNESQGASTGHPPIQVSKITTIANTHAIYWLNFLNAVLCCWWLENEGVYKIRRAENIVITPPNLLGMERRIA